MCHSAGYTNAVTLDTKTKRVAAIMLFAIETGMRMKEMTRLTWGRVYADKKYLHVDDDSKTGRRDVPMSIKAISIITSLACVRDGDLVFQLNESQVDSLFRKLKGMAQCEGFTFHDTKHLACTRLAKKLTPFDLARVVGTRDLKTLMLYYNESASDIAGKLG
jgi:integrase